LINLISLLPVHAKNVTIGITQAFVDPDLDAVREGFKFQLEKNGLREGVNLKIIYENAYGDPLVIKRISGRLIDAKPDLVFVLTTPSALSLHLANKDKTIPIVFASVTDPLGAKLIYSIETPGEFITGTTDFPPIKEQLFLMKQIMGKKTFKLGVVYNSQEPGAEFMMKRLKEYAAPHNIQIIAKSVDAKNILSEVRSMIPLVDAVYAPLDNVVSSVMPDLVELCLENEHGRKIPVFSGNPEGVRQGALATVGFTHYQEGLLAGRIVSRILAGEKPGNIPVSSPDSSELYINTTSAKALGLEIPKAIIKKASDVVRFE
jgi:putative ABC transport system substrate-binding protein